MNKQDNHLSYWLLALVHILWNMLRLSHLNLFCASNFFYIQDQNESFQGNCCPSQILSHPGRHSSLHGSVHLLHWRTSLIWKSVKLCSLNMKVTKINIDASTVSTISATADSIKEEQEKNEPELQPQGQEQQLHQDLQSHWALFQLYLKESFASLNAILCGARSLWKIR